MSAKYTITALSEAHNQSQSLFRYIAPELILPNPKQPRRTIEPEALATLKESIRERGILQPLLVMRGEEGKYILVAGQRRLAAARELRLVRVPVMVLNESRPDYLVDSLLENIQREELSGIDEGYSFIALKEEFNWTQREIAAKIHKHESYVSERIRTAERLTATTKEIIAEAFSKDENLARAKFSHSINRKLALLPADEQEALARQVASNMQITARQVETLVREKLGNTKFANLAPVIEQLPENPKPAKNKTGRGDKIKSPSPEQLSFADMPPQNPTDIAKKRRTNGQKAPIQKLTLDFDAASLNPALVETLELIMGKIADGTSSINLTELVEAIRRDCLTQE
jgi:ParB family transcriptional regulator, chromosome partitioning protein